LEELDLDVSIILKLICKKCDGGMAWIGNGSEQGEVARFVNAVMNLRFP
jgi:hypothetical protein